MRTMEFPKRYLVVILTLICTSVCYIERVGFSIAYTFAADAAGVNQASKGTILSTFYCAYACSQVPGGWAAQKIWGRKVLLLSFVLWSATCALVPWDPNRVFVMVIARLLVGVAQGFCFSFRKVSLWNMEMIAFLNCLAANQLCDEKCVKQKELLGTCMEAQSNKNKSMGSINYHLRRPSRGRK